MFWWGVGVGGVAEVEVGADWGGQFGGYIRGLVVGSGVRVHVHTVI